MEGVLDWDAPELLTLLYIDQWNGFGFQCDKEQEAKPCRIYIARIYKEESFDAAKFLEQIRPKYTNQEVWITDFLGYDFLTVSTAMFKRIPEVMNDCLIFGYSILTHTCVKALFTPGMVFNQRNFELGLIHTVNENYRLISEIKELKDTWGYLKKILKFGPLKREFNWTTEEGKAFCRELRLKLRSKRPVTRCFNHFEKHKDVCRKYGIFGYEEKEEVSAKKLKLEEEECIICMERPASTIVFPCECKVVCAECSEKLKTTPDTKICSKCRRDINMVIYVESNKIEEK